MTLRKRSFPSQPDAPRCARCHVAGRPPAGGTKMCQMCRDIVRVQNKQRRAAKHAWEMQKARDLGVRPIEQREAEDAARRQQHMDQMVAFAQEHGRVPTLHEVAEITGKGFTGVLRTWRIEAFDLAPLGKGFKGGIPYPVPAELRRKVTA